MYKERVYRRMTKGEKIFIKVLGEVILGQMCRTPSHLIPKRGKYKIVGLGRDPLYVVKYGSGEILTALTNRGFRKESWIYD